jgi:hypothetical protein
MRRTLPLCSLLLLVGCGSSLDGKWRDEHRTLQFNDGYVHIYDDRYPREQLAAINPNNPLGLKLNARYSTEDGWLTYVGRDGLLPTVPELTIRGEYVLEGDVLAEQVLRAVGTRQGLAGTWRGTVTTLGLTAGPASEGDRTTVLTLGSDGTAARDVSIGTATTPSDAVRGTWVAEGNAARITWPPSEVSATPTIETYALVTGQAVLSPLVSTRVD